MNGILALKKQLPKISSSSEQRRSEVRLWFTSMMHSGSEQAISALMMFHTKLVRMYVDADDCETATMLLLALCCFADELEKQLLEFDNPSEETKAIGKQFADLIHEEQS